MPGKAFLAVHRSAIAIDLLQALSLVADPVLAFHTALRPFSYSDVLARRRQDFLSTPPRLPSAVSPKSSPAAEWPT